MLRTLPYLFFLLSFSVAKSQDFEWLGIIKNKKAYVKVLSEDAIVIIMQNNDSDRYVSAQLPEEWKQDGLKFTFTGQVGKIPPHYKMLGTPLKLIAISTTKKEAQNFGLKKRKYKFF